MRLPVPRNRLVALTILAAVLTGAVTVGLADPALLPGVSTGPSSGDAVLADSQPLGPSDGAAAPATDAGASAGEPTSADPAPSVAPIPTPNPNFTPAVQTATVTTSRGEHDRERGGEHEWDDD